MRITKDNYEALLLDYLDGNLHPSKVEQLRAFLRHNPELAVNIDDFEIHSLQPDEDISFPSGDSLKKKIIPAGNINENNFEEYFIAHHEKLLRPDESDDLFRFLELNPFLRKSYGLFGMAYLKADQAVVYPDKNALLKKAFIPLIIHRWYYLAVPLAAAILVTFMVQSIWFARNDDLLPQPSNPALTVINKQEANQV